jgi:hypothetical protein
MIMLAPAVLLLLFVLLLPFWQLKVLNMVVTLTAIFGSTAMYYLMHVSCSQASLCGGTFALCEPLVWKIVDECMALYAILPFCVCSFHV